MLQKSAAHTASLTEARLRVGKMASQQKAPAGPLSNKKKKRRSQQRRAVITESDQRHVSTAPVAPVRLPASAEFSKLPPSTQVEPFLTAVEERLAAAVEERFAAPAAASSNTATTPSSPCQRGTETEFELSSTFCRTDHFSGINQCGSANSDTDNASATRIPHIATITAAAAMRTANKLSTLPRRSLQSLAKRFGIKANAKSTIIITSLIDRGYISPAPASASPSSIRKVETVTEPCNQPQCRSNHFTEQSNQDDVTDDDDHDNADAASTDRPPDSSTAPCTQAAQRASANCTPVPHDATTTANAIVSSTSNTKSKKRGSHPASRRQRKRAAAAAVAASAASSPEHMSPTTSPSPDPKETERKLYNLLYAASTTTAPTPPAQMSDRVA